MAIAGRKRVFGDKIEFKSLTCAPVNELDVVYVFGVLHEAFGLEIEPIQSGYPDYIARRRIGPNRWEEVRIEFEYDSRSFLTHGHDPTGVDAIVCWRHNWPECPKRIEVIELSALLTDAEKIIEEGKEGGNGEGTRRLNAWQAFCQQKRLEGIESFAEIARLWRSEKSKRPADSSGCRPESSAR